MRQRKVKNLELRLEELAYLVIKDPRSHRGKWKEIFGNDRDIFMELGCGKGKFIMQQAMEHPDKNFIAVEGQDTVILRALEKTQEQKLSNIRFIDIYINEIEEFFEEDELSGIYLNFSDPWPKERHAKRRLTHSKFLEGYRRVLKSQGFVEFKTDNDLLFEFSMEQITEGNFKVAELSKDLHQTELPAKNITTEYEERFKNTGKNINYVKVIF